MPDVIFARCFICYINFSQMSFGENKNSKKKIMKRNQVNFCGQD
jgi:hypothetical protein